MASTLAWLGKRKKVKALRAAAKAGHGQATVTLFTELLTADSGQALSVADREYALSAIKKPMNDLYEHQRWECLEKLHSMGARPKSESLASYHLISSKGPTSLLALVLADRTGELGHDFINDHPVQRHLTWRCPVPPGRDVLQSITESELAAVHGHVAAVELLTQELLVGARAFANIHLISIYSTKDYATIMCALSTAKNQAELLGSTHHLECVDILRAAANDPLRDVQDRKTPRSESVGVSALASSYGFATTGNNLSDPPQPLNIERLPSFEQLIMNKLVEMTHDISSLRSEIAELRSQEARPKRSPPTTGLIDKWRRCRPQKISTFPTEGASKPGH